mgnify:CR=1 FL=1
MRRRSLAEKPSSQQPCSTRPKWWYPRFPQTPRTALREHRIRGHITYPPKLYSSHRRTSLERKTSLSARKLETSCDTGERSYTSGHRPRRVGVRGRVLDDVIWWWWWLPTASHAGTTLLLYHTLGQSATRLAYTTVPRPASPLIKPTPNTRTAFCYHQSIHHTTPTHHQGTFTSTFFLHVEIIRKINNRNKCNNVVSVVVCQTTANREDNRQGRVWYGPQGAQPQHRYGCQQ